MINKLKLEKSFYIPSVLQPGILYFSEEFDVACHLCPCGCGNKIVTPIGPTDWSFSDENGEPTLSPSIGNWQIPCRSHYWIDKGLIKWSYQWDEEEISAGRQMEKKRREIYYEKMHPDKGKKSFLSKILDWFKSKNN